MLINNMDISEFNARVLEVDIQNSSISNSNSSYNPNNLEPVFFESETDLNIISVTLLVDTDSKEQYYIDKSNLIYSLLKPCELVFNDRNLRFKAILMNQISLTANRQVLGKLTLMFKGYNIQDEVTETITDNTVVTNPGNRVVPCNLEITPVSDLIDLTIKGLSDDPIIIKNLEGSKTVFLSGEKGTILVDGKNKFDDTDLWEFPHLKVGENKINISNPNCSIQLKYRARFL